MPNWILILAVVSVIVGIGLTIYALFRVGNALSQAEAGKAVRGNSETMLLEARLRELAAAQSETDPQRRVEAYRRLTACRSDEELGAAEREFLDRFGPLPETVLNFVRTMRVKIRAAAWNLSSVSKGREGIVLKYRDRKPAEALRKRDPEHVRIMDEDTILVVGRDVADVLAK